METAHIQTFYFLGIGGIGMSALARYFNASGKRVIGYDKTPTPLTDELIREGISIHFEDDIEYFRTLTGDDKTTVIVYTPAIPKEHRELSYFRANGYRLFKRSEVLGMLTEEAFTIAVAGTHGKTTTSSIVAHLLKSSGQDISAFLGGITRNYGTNFLLGEGLKPGTSAVKPIVVVEADEYDRSFLTLHPDIAIITSLDADHLDIYGSAQHVTESYNEFAQRVHPDGRLLVKAGLGIQRGHLTYSIRQAADFRTENIRIVNHSYVFDFTGPYGTLQDLTLGLPGIHNVENATAAIAVAQMQGVQPDAIRRGLASYEGVRRRFDYQIKSPGLVYLDDYAHHPEELRACITSVRELYPGRKITGIFQPHLFSRTRDFAEGFAQSLSLLDRLLLLDIYPARELPIEGVSSQMLLDRMSLPDKKLCPREEVLNELGEVDVLITLGAGDIDQLVQPIKNYLLKKLSDGRNN
jgi:UDP-N-acetylmuramate--alanine ligase